jgi:DNA-binding response OmpR family regulator
MPTILVVNHDFAESEMLTTLLLREGYTTRHATNTRDAYSMLVNGQSDLCLINLSLHGVDGLSLCRRIRQNNQISHLPVVFITSPDSPYMAADALNAGGDDYLRHPFKVRELAARLRAHLRRAALHNQEDLLPVLELDPNALSVRVNDRVVMLTRVEYDLLAFLCSAPHQLHSTENLLADVWQYPRGAGDSALVRNHIRNLRLKLESDPDHPTLIQSRHGRGYAVKAQVGLYDEANRERV